MNNNHRMEPQTQCIRPWVMGLPAMAWYTTPPAFETLAQRFDPISLREMDSVALLDRIDTKFVLSTSQLLAALEPLTGDYRILSAGGQRLNYYRTLYFDTPGFALFHAHVNGQAERYKVRSREYVDSSLFFFEVKHHTRKDRTIKDRVRTSEPALALNDQLKGWLGTVSPIDGCDLEPKIWNTFTRLTLVSKLGCERVTLDVNLAFYSGEKLAQLSGVAVAEVKRDANNCFSPFLAQMSALKVRPQGFSKYSIGVSMLYDGVKKNALKPKMLQLEKLMKGTVCCD